MLEPSLYRRKHTVLDVSCRVRLSTCYMAYEYSPDFLFNSVNPMIVILPHSAFAYLSFMSGWICREVFRTVEEETTENARLELSAPSKMQGVENAGLELLAPYNRECKMRDCSLVPIIPVPHFPVSHFQHPLEESYLQDRCHLTMRQGTEVRTGLFGCPFVFFVVFCRASEFCVKLRHCAETATCLSVSCSVIQFW